MKKTDLEKAKALKLMGNLRAGAPPRFGKPDSALSRRERRTLDQKNGLIPFAIKLDEALVKQLRALADTRNTAIDALVAELLANALKES